MFAGQVLILLNFARTSVVSLCNHFHDFLQFKKMEDHELYITNFTLSVFQSCALLIKKRTNKSFRNSKFTAVANDVIQERN